MNYRGISAFFITVACCFVAVRLWAADGQFDPLKQITRPLLGTIEFKQNGRLLEFCPDNTCHGFAATKDVSVASLKDFAYLYIYFFSDYYVLQEWRNRAEVKSTAKRVLSKPGYRNCEDDNDREAARCVLRDLSSNGRIKLLFIRYDEGQRNVARKNIAEELSEKKPISKE